MKALKRLSVESPARESFSELKRAVARIGKALTLQPFNASTNP